MSMRQLLGFAPNSCAWFRSIEIPQSVQSELSAGKLDWWSRENDTYFTLEANADEFTLGSIRKQSDGLRYALYLRQG